MVVQWVAQVCNGSDYKTLVRDNGNDETPVPTGSFSRASYFYPILYQYRTVLATIQRLSVHGCRTVLVVQYSMIARVFCRIEGCRSYEELFFVIYKCIFLIVA